MKPLVWIGLALMVAWAVLWLGVKIAVGAIHALLVLGAVLLVWGLVHHRLSRRQDGARDSVTRRSV